MASSTNQEHQQTAGAASSNLTNLQQQQQRQQQELLKILAQHFHNQFYQINGAQQNNMPAMNQLATGSVNHKLHHPTASSNFDYQQQRNQVQFQNESSLLQTGCLNLVTQNNTNSAHQLFQQSLRSQQAAANNTSNNLPLNMAELPLDFAASLGAGAGQQAASNPLNLYSTMNHDMNLLSALGLNLTNNQLVLSLQQQSLHQAAAAAAVARQYELARGEAVAAAAMAAAAATTSPTSINTDAQTRISRCPTNDTVASNGFQADEDECHERQLKFSIKTILSGGTGSPKPGALIRSVQNNAGQTNQALVGDSANALQEASNKLLRIQTEADDEQNPHQLQRSSDYEATESYSDSSSINASTPTPQTSASMLTFNQTSYSSDHQRATQLNSPALITTSNLATQNHNQINNLKFHQQPAHTQRNNIHQQQHHPLPFLPGSTAFPWTVAARGKPRRGMMRRAVFSDSQRVGLEKRFQLQKYISKPDRKKLAEKLGLRDSQVKIWFQNRRMKWRNSKERELLSAGGSREQTLPTRNNPNPDLSDVGETIKRLTTTSNSVSNVSFNK